MIEGARKGQKWITEEHCLPDSFTLESAALLVGDHPELIGSVFAVLPERIPEVAGLLGITADPDHVDYYLVARSDQADPE
jgi:hypothetical protein